MENFNQVISYFSDPLFFSFDKIPCSIKHKVQEIRLRILKPIVLVINDKNYFLNKDSTLNPSDCSNALKLSQKDLFSTFEKMCNYSIYSYQQEIKNGHITLKGGHRVGLCGTALIKQNSLAGIRDISSLNVRISRNISCLNENDFKKIKDQQGSILVVGEPACGKTTLLRELGKNFSSQQHKNKVVLIDERAEIAGSFLGVPQKDVGFCDVLTGFKKSDGIIHSIKNLAPNIIICDEIGKVEDISSIKEGLNSGVDFVVSIHVSSIKDLFKKECSRLLIKTLAFNTIVLLNGRHTPGKIEKIYSLGEFLDEINGDFDSNFKLLRNGAYEIA